MWRHKKPFVWRKSCSTGYTMHSMDGEAAFQTHILVKYYRGKYNREGVKYFTYAVYDIGVTVYKTFKEYWKRFGIEYSYKLMDQARTRTSTKKTVLRPLYAGLCFLLVNIWISFNGPASAYLKEGIAKP